MMRSGQTSKTTVALFVAVVILASSTLYLAAGALQASSDRSLAGQVSQKLQSYSVASVDPNATTVSALNSITVSGSGEASYTPDEALIAVSVVTQNSTAGAATQTNAARTTSVIRALEGIGIANSSIRTQGYSLNVDYSNCYSSPCLPSITGYTVTNSLQVNITSSSPSNLGVKAGKVIDTAVNAGANQVYLYFGATQSLMEELNGEALRNAVGSADSTAQTIAGSLGVSITGVISASEGSNFYPQYYSYPVAFTASLAGSNYSTPIVPGTQTVSVTVQVVYSI